MLLHFTQIGSDGVEVVGLVSVDAVESSVSNDAGDVVSLKLIDCDVVGVTGAELIRRV